MHIRKHLTTGLAMVGLALALTVAPAHAADALKGAFELPSAVYWGNALLQPGVYTVWMSTEARDVAHTPVIHVSGEGVSLSFLAIAKPQPESGRNYLEIAEVGGAQVVRTFEAGLLGESFGFSVTKAVKNKALRASAEPVMTVTVSTPAGY